MNKNRIFYVILFTLTLAYTLSYFNYFETPTADYMGNFKPRIIEYMNGDFPGKNYKILPLFPVLLAVLTPLSPVASEDKIYMTALILNMLLFIPAIFLVFRMFSKYLDGVHLKLALVFIAVNIYTVYTAVNGELEMLLTFFILLSVFLSLKQSRLAYAAAFFSSIIKWDAVFTVPAAMYGDFFVKKKRIIALTLGALAISGTVLWLAGSYMGRESHQYVKEIARRGPNIYRYLIDCVLFTSGYVQWMALDGYSSGNLLYKASLYGISVISGLAAFVSIFSGAVIFIRRNIKGSEPLLVFLAGFLAIHMIYQNTKERYVLPILWLLIIFMFYGFSFFLYPAIRNFLTKRGDRFQDFLMTVVLMLLVPIFLLSLYVLSDKGGPVLFVFSAAFTTLTWYLIFEGGFLSGKRFTAVVLLTAATLINFQVGYGRMNMDHYSLRQVEFKKAGIWFRDNHKPGERIMMTEHNTAIYYSGLDRSLFANTSGITSKDIGEFVVECRQKGVAYVFVDDFYIRRLKVNDKNAIERNAAFMREIRDKAPHDKNFELVTTFNTGKDIKSYIYRIVSPGK